jgi:hypothetical protein
MQAGASGTFMEQVDLRIVEELISGPVSVFSNELGGLEFYGYSPEFRDLVRFCHDFTMVESGESVASRKAYLFLPTSHGKSTFARAVASQASANGLDVLRFDGTLGSTSKELRELQARKDVLVIVDDVPETSQTRSTLLDRFNALKGPGLLFARPEYSSDANLRPDIPTITIAHVDERYFDKEAWLLGLVLESLRDQTGAVPEESIAAFRSLPKGVFATLCRVPLGEKVSNLRGLTEKIGQTIQLGVSLGTIPVLSDEDLAAIFVEFHSSGSPQNGAGFRLWVEGESDSRLLRLVSRLAHTAYGIDLGQGLTIIPLGVGRDGGTSKVTGIVVGQRTKRNRDVFLLDCDEPGRHAQQELEILDQDVLLLDVKLACARMDEDVEIEDLISVGCLDRFYAENSSLRPEREIIRYKPPMSRRLVINGTDKELLIEWLELHAELKDLENVLFMLCEARSRFSLRNLPAMKDKHTWKKRLAEEIDSYKCLGMRSDQWSC